MRHNEVARPQLRRPGRGDRALPRRSPAGSRRYDLTSATCSSTWCGPVIRPYLMFKDDNHWNQTFMRAHFAPLLRPILEAAVARISA